MNKHNAATRHDLLNSPSVLRGAQPCQEGRANCDPIVQPEPKISSAFGRLELAAAKNTDLVNQLAEKIHPVLRLSPTNSVLEEKEEGLLVPLAERLHGSARKLEAINAVLRDLIERVEC